MSGLGLTSGVIGAILIALTLNTPGRESNSEALLFLALFWAIIPLITALPFVILGGTGRFLPAYFESVSAFTTTGASALVPEELPDALVFWRALLQWFGGVSIATFAVVILAALNLTGTGIHRSVLFTLKKGELFERLIAIGRLVAAIYAGLSAVTFMLMLIGGTAPFDAICLALSGVSTGGLTPQSGPLAHYLSPFAATVLAILCILGAMNMAIIWDVLRLRNLRNLRRIIFNLEHRTLWALVSALTLLAVFFSGVDNLFGGLLDSLYFISTAGFQYDVLGIDMVPSVVLISLALIGGSALSTAGGVKIMRFILLFRHLGTDLGRLSHPSRIVPVKLRTRRIADKAFLSVWMYFFAYALVFGLGVAAFGAAGFGLSDAIVSSSASLTNMGPLLPLTLPDSGLTYSDFTGIQMFVSIILMLLGRVEILAVLALFMPAFWRQ
ncbi:MAG: potassium transporter TrkG [Litorimonas sp.]